jgi:hypothetical protein
MEPGGMRGKNTQKEQINNPLPLAHSLGLFMNPKQKHNEKKVGRPTIYAF